MFRAWPKTPRWENETYSATEKIDGTNACVVVQDGSVFAQNRTRMITIDNDNFGFAKWVYENTYDLLDLGEGHHYGEWWGAGIQRRYGLDHKRFSLFQPWKCLEIPECCHIVPEVFSKVPIDQIDAIIKGFTKSIAAPDYTGNPEGVIIVSDLTRATYKYIKDK